MLEVDLVIGEKINSHINKTKPTKVVGADSELDTIDMSRNETNSKNVVAELNMLEEPKDMLDLSIKAKRKVEKLFRWRLVSVIMLLN